MMTGRLGPNSRLPVLATPPRPVALPLSLSGRRHNLDKLWINHAPVVTAADDSGDGAAEEIALESENGVALLDFFTQADHPLIDAKRDDGKDWTPETLSEFSDLARAFPVSYLTRLLEPNRLPASSKSLWNHLVTLARIEDPYERFFYAETCYHEHWPLTRLKDAINTKRFQTYTISRQNDWRLRQALIELSQGNRKQWIYRDLVRFDFLNLDPEKFEAMTEPEFEDLMVQNVIPILEEFGDGFRLEGQQQAIRFRDPEDPNAGVQEIRLDILLNVEESHGVEGAFPLIVELKKVPFGKSVLKQCERYLRVFEMHDEVGVALFNHAGSPARVMAFVPKANVDYINAMKLGLYGDQNINPIFVSVYTYCRPNDGFLQIVIGDQMQSSAKRAIAQKSQWQHHHLFYLDVGAEPDVELPF